MSTPPPLPHRSELAETGKFGEVLHDSAQPHPPQRHRLTRRTLWFSILALVLCGLTIALVLTRASGPIPKIGEKGAWFVILIGLMGVGSTLCALAGTVTAVVALVQMSRAARPYAGKNTVVTGGIISAVIAALWVFAIGVLGPKAQQHARKKDELLNIQQISGAMVAYSMDKGRRLPRHPVLLAPYMGANFNERMAGTINPKGLPVESTVDALRQEMRDLLEMEPVDVEFGAFRFGGYWFAVQPANFDEMRSPSAHVVAFSRRFHSSPDGRAVAFADTSVRWMVEKNFQEFLKIVNDDRVRHLKLKPIEPDDLGPAN